jgi:hypothetical protein
MARSMIWLQHAWRLPGALHREQQATFRSIRVLFRATCPTFRLSRDRVLSEMSASIFIGAGSIGLGLVLGYRLLCSADCCSCVLGSVKLLSREGKGVKGFEVRFVRRCLRDFGHVGISHPMLVVLEAVV